MATYKTILTNIGLAKITNAIALGEMVNLTNMAVGDGNGNPTTPVQTQTALVREVFRASINQLSIDPDNANYLIAEMIVPTTVGGWAVHEVGIFDDEDNLIAVANFPATYKPALAEGSGRDLVVRIIIQVSNVSVVTLQVNPAIILASQAWVADQYLKRIKVAGGTTGQVLAKSSNANEAFEWVDPTAAVNVVVDAIPERQTLAAGQVIVDLAIISTVGIAVYIEGARLIETIDFTITNATRITLARSYPAGTRIHMYQNDPTSTTADASETARGFVELATAAEALAGTDTVRAVTPAGIRAAFSAVGAAPIFACRAWVRTTGGTTIGAGGNVSSISSPATGRLVVNFAVALPDANYAVSVAVKFTNAAGTANIVGGVSSYTTQTASACELQFQGWSSSSAVSPEFSAAFFR